MGSYISCFYLLVIQKTVQTSLLYQWRWVNPLHPNIWVNIFSILFFIHFLGYSDREKLFNNQGPPLSVIISCILMTLMHDSGWYCKEKLDASHSYDSKGYQLKGWLEKSLKVIFSGRQTFSLSFVGQYQTIWKENLIVHHKSLWAFSLHLFSFTFTVSESELYPTRLSNVI